MAIESPALVFEKFLRDMGLFTLPSTETTWPIYENSLPDDPKRPRNVDIAGSFDTPGVLHGKIRGGTLVQHVGVQLRLRVGLKDFQTGYSKMKNVEDTLAPLSNVTVNMASGNSFRIANFVQTTPIVNMGQDEDRRHHFSLNYIMAITKL